MDKKEVIRKKFFYKRKINYFKIDKNFFYSINKIDKKKKITKI